jgi:SAM-dependent methyltransferase
MAPVLPENDIALILSLLISIQKKNDPFGLAIYDHWKGIGPAHIEVHIKDFDPDLLDAGYLFRTFSEMPEIEKQALELCRGRILDCGAGAGAHALELQSRGFDVHAIDVSGGAVEVMKERGVRSIGHTNIFDQDGQFDTLLFLMNGIGMAAELEGLTKLLTHCRDLLSPDGQILLDSSDMIYLHDGDIPDNMNEYYGELKYNLKYKDQESGYFNWLYVDPETMKETALASAYSVERIVSGPHYDYLMQLKKLDQI